MVAVTVAKMARLGFALLCVAACQDNVGSINFTLNYMPPLTKSFPCAGRDPRKPNTLHVKITTPEGDVFEQTVPFGQSIVQFDIPVGPARLITVDVINQQGCIIYTGTRLPTSFAEGDNGTLPVTVKPPTRQLAPEYADEDGDGLSLCEETAFGTDDHKKDTDGDGADDFCEITGAGGRCTDPLNAQSHPPMGACGGNADAGVEP